MTRSLTRLLIRLLTLAAVACRPAPVRENKPANVLASVSAIRNLPPTELAKGLSVKIQGVVTSYGHEGYVYYLQDSTGGIRVDPGSGRDHPAEWGEQMTIEGVTAPGPSIVRPHAEWQGHAAMPTPRTVAPPQLHDAGVGDWIELDGVVSAAMIEKGRLVLLWGDGTERVRAEAISYDAAEGLALVGAHVRVRGVKAIPPNGASEETLLYVPTRAEITVVSPGAARASAAVIIPSKLPLLTHAVQVRNLSAVEAEKAYPVHIHGVVTFYIPPLLFIQDDSCGIYVRAPIHDAALTTGQPVELWGISGPGQFAPIIDLPRIKILGPPGPMPKPLRVTMERMFSGELDSQWVEVDGLVVRRVEPDRITFASGYRQFRAWVPSWEMQPLPRQLLNARVRVRGVTNVYFNQKRQVMGVAMSVYSLHQIDVTEPAPETASLPVDSIMSLLRFSPEGGRDRRVRVQGTVMMSRGSHTVYVTDATGAAEVQTEEDASALQSGDLVDVLGFPTPGGFAPVLLDALVRKTGSGRMREPIAITATDAMNGEHDLDWVQITGRLLDATEATDEQILTLQSDRTVFTAHVDKRAPVTLRNGSLLRLTGLCSVQVDENRVARGFQLMVRSPRDINVLARPPWLKAEHVAIAFGLLAILGFMVHRLHLMNVRAGFKAVSEERTRLAREIHDTLQQRLVGVLMQLEVMAQQKGAAERTGESLDQARTLVRSSMAEARRLVRNLRSPVLDEGDLPQALQSVVEQLSAGSDTRIDLRVVGKPRRLADITENNLLRIGQEALVNALKHGSPKHVRVELCFEPKSVRLGVQDDGCGFDGATLPPNGHFGVIGMRERAQQLGGRLELRSTPGAGTDVQVAVPLEG
jgi:signal transduction histidine kinase